MPSLAERSRLGGGVRAHLITSNRARRKDGVTLTVAAGAPQPGRRRCGASGLCRGYQEKVQQLVKTLPQKIRAKLVPVPEFAAELPRRWFLPTGGWCRR